MIHFSFFLFWDILQNEHSVWKQQQGKLRSLFVIFPSEFGRDSYILTGASSRQFCGRMRSLDLPESFFPLSFSCTNVQSSSTHNPNQRKLCTNVSKEWGLWTNSFREGMEPLDPVALWHNSHHHSSPHCPPLLPLLFSDRGKAEPSAHEFKSPNAATHSHSTSSTLQPFAAVVSLTLSRCAAFYLVVTLGYQRGNIGLNRNLIFFFFTTTWYPLNYRIVCDGNSITQWQPADGM